MLSALVIAFAAWVTVHLAIVVGLIARRPRWRALAALLLPPLGPYWAASEGMRKRVWIWVASVVVYAVARFLAVT